MNQTDGPEIERALRAATCPLCAINDPVVSPPGCAVAHRRGFCSSRHAELLPLFQQAVEAACDQLINDKAHLMMELAGAYAAAAKVIDEFKPDEFNDVPTGNLIRALTLADAWQAQADVIQKAVADVTEKFCFEKLLLESRLRTIGMAGEFGESTKVVERIRELEYTEHQARQYMQNARSRERRINELEQAIASAEARARLGEL